MTTQSTGSDTENPSGEESPEKCPEKPTVVGLAYVQLLATSSLEELEEEP